MKHFFQKLNFWWFATMTPQYTPLTTISQRETLRKRRLLSIVIMSSLILIMLSVTSASSITSTLQLFLGWITSCVLLLALWLNRRGYLVLASLLLFLIEGCGSSLTVYIFSLSNPISLLWSLFPIALLLVTAGLFLPAWIIVLMGIVETLFTLWYLLFERYTLLISLLSPHALWSFLIYLVLVISISTMIGALYTATTKKALIQADRAAELEQAHNAVTEAYRDQAEAHRKLEVAYATIEKQALTDGLTGLPNHRAVMDQFNKELDRARRHDLPFSLLFFDADHFKRVNDTHSHTTGDAVLCQIGERASRVLRSGDTLGRFGGEEFIVLLPETTAHEAAFIAERIRNAVASEPMAASQVEEGIFMTVSIGLSTYTNDGDSEQVLLSHADEAMYMAKRLGRNQVRTAEEVRQMSADAELMTLFQQEEQLEAAQREEGTPELLRETDTLHVIYSLLSLLERRDVNVSTHTHGVSDLTTTISQMTGLLSKEVSKIDMSH